MLSLKRRMRQQAIVEQSQDEVIVSRIKLIIVAAAILVTMAWSQSKGADQEGLKYWPQWRGPLANGVAPEANPPVTWGEGQNIKWKVKCLGGGCASPIVWGDKVFLLAAVPTDIPAPAQPNKATADDSPASKSTAESAQSPSKREDGPGQKGPGQGPGAAKGSGKRAGGMPPPFKPTVYYTFEVVCLDRKTGAVVWQQTARQEVPHEGYREGDGGYACYSPLTDGKYVYAYFGSRGLYCYDFDGNRKWQRDLGKMNIVMQFGEGGSPALCGDKIIVNRDHQGASSIVAIDKRTGDTIWQVKRDETTSWATPLVVEHEGKSQVVVSATKRVRCYDPDTGTVLWECGGQTRNVIPSPVYGFGMVFATSGFQGNALQAIALGRTGDLTGSDAVKWSVDRGTPYVPSPLLYGDKLYVFANNNAILSCYQAETGAANFTQKRLEGLTGVYASPVGAADRVYLVSRNGKAMVIKRSADLEVLATNTLDEGFDASLAIAGDEMFLRGKEYLYCIGKN